MCNGKSSPPTTQSKIEKTEKTDNSNSNEDSSNNNDEAKQDEYFPWWRGGGRKPKTGREMGVFESSLEDRANCLQLWTMTYLNPLLSLGSRKVLDSEDVGVPSSEDRASIAYDKTKAEFDLQLKKAEEHNAPIKRSRIPTPFQDLCKSFLFR